MESMGDISEGEWSSLSGMYTAEEAAFMAQLLNNHSAPNELHGVSSSGIPSGYWTPGHEPTMNLMTGIDESSFYSSETSSSNLYRFSQGSSFSAGSSQFLTSSTDNYYFNDSHPMLMSSNSPMSMDLCMGNARGTSSCLLEGRECLNQEMSEEEPGANQSSEAAIPGKNMHFESESEINAAEVTVENKSNLLENSKKRSRSTGDIQKTKRSSRSKKNHKLPSTSCNEEEGNTAGQNGQSTCACCSEDDSFASQETNAGVTSCSSPKGSSAVNSSGKTRASRGSATDPQSLYARKRRERINERLRILQNLVPNGTKVDISTMLEEAVQYVKFLQLQIKLLSSDDLWMYAPIAYNGMDIGLDLKMATP